MPGCLTRERPASRPVARRRRFATRCRQSPNGLTAQAPTDLIPGFPVPTVFTHPVVPLAIGMALGRRIVPPRLVACGAIAAILPDLDVLAFRLGIPYATEFGHRGFSHSLLFALVAALLGACCFRWLRANFLRSFLFLLMAVGSHGLLDTLTDGGLGIALLWPWSDHRYFAPFQPIAVAPLGLSRFFSERGVTVLKSEFLWVCLPAFATSVALFGARVATLRRARTHRSPLATRIG